MKKGLKVLAASLALAALCTPALVASEKMSVHASEVQVSESAPQVEVSATSPSIKSVFVFGAGSVSAAPDMATICLGVETLNHNLEEAVADNSETISGLVDYLISQNISDENIKTQNYNIYQRHDYSASSKFLGYQVSSTLEFVTTDLDGISSLITELTSLGANRLNGITFGCQDMSSYYTEALKLALEDAKTKAQVLSGQDMDILSINEEYAYTYVPCKKAGSLMSNSNSVMPGSFEIEAKVKVRFVNED